MSKSNETVLRDEVKREFQLERVILFTDAVFAIVITLMAIEIRLPEESAGHELGLGATVKKLVPVISAYAASFFFIGAIWYQHLRMFGLLKDFDRGLIVRNMALLFLVGLFPFCATVITHGKGSGYAMSLYLGIIFLCTLAQYALYHYIVVQRPQLRVSEGLGQHLYQLKRRKIIVIMLGVALILMSASFQVIQDPGQSPLAMAWVIIVPIALKLFGPKKPLAEQ